MTVNEEHIFSAEYAASLVQRARDGATFVFVPWGNSGEWRRQSDCPNWVAWYRETDAAIKQASLTDHGNAWLHAENDLLFIRDDFADACGVLSSLCQLPAEWTEAHRGEARRIGGAT